MTHAMKPGKRNYKDALFRDIFKEPTRLAGLYEALEGIATSPEEIQLMTIDETLFSGIKNDVSFFVRDRHVVLAEHQSTVNANMPLRLAMYLMELYRQYIPADAVYKKELISLPAPRCYVLYNGMAEMPDEQILRLSEAFDGDADVMELIVKVININDAPHREILKRCQSLKSYSVFIAKLREHINNGVLFEPAVSDAIDYCINHDYLREYFQRKYKEEVFDMLNFAWDQERALEVRAEEAMEKGRKEGRKEGLERGLEQGLEQGLEKGLITSIRKMVERLGVSIEKAMDVLEIPTGERAKYAMLVKG